MKNNILFTTHLILFIIWTGIALFDTSVYLKNINAYDSLIMILAWLCAVIWFILLIWDIKEKK